MLTFFRTDIYYSKMFYSKGEPFSVLCNQWETYQHLLVLPESHCVTVNIDENLFQISNALISWKRIVHAFNAELCQSIR